MKKPLTTFGATSTTVAFGITLKSKGNMATNDTVTAKPMRQNIIQAIWRNQWLSYKIMIVEAIMTTIDATVGKTSQVK
jgi:hypothetical protein